MNKNYGVFFKFKKFKQDVYMYIYSNYMYIFAALALTVAPEDILRSINRIS